MAHSEEKKIVQVPNKSSVAATLFAVAVIFIDKQPFESLAYAGFVIAGTIWSWQEVSGGINIFRRILGALVLLGIAYTLYQR